MKILTISTRKDTFSALPEDEKNRLNVATIKHLIELKKKMGNKFTIYSIPGWGRAVSIGDYASLEEYSQSLQTLISQQGYSNHESYPLIEMDEKQMEAYLKQVKTTKQYNSFEECIIQELREYLRGLPYSYLSLCSNFYITNTPRYSSTDFLHVSQTIS